MFEGSDLGTIAGVGLILQNLHLTDKRRKAFSNEINNTAIKLTLVV